MQNLRLAFSKPILPLLTFRMASSVNAPTRGVASGKFAAGQTIKLKCLMQNGCKLLQSTSKKSAPPNYGAGFNFTDLFFLHTFDSSSCTKLFPYRTEYLVKPSAYELGKIGPLVRSSRIYRVVSSRFSDHARLF